jgi:integrase
MAGQLLDDANAADDTIADAVGRHLADLASSGHQLLPEDSAVLTEHAISAWGEKPANSITRAHVLELTAKLENPPHARAVLRTLFANHPGPNPAELTFGDAADAYLDSLTTRGAPTAHLYRQTIDRELGDWRDRPATSISQAEAYDRIQRILARATTPGGNGTAANKLRAIIGSVYRHARRTGYELPSPTEFIPYPAPRNVARHRVLSDNEIRILWPVWSRDDNLGGLYQIMLLTGQRPGDCRKMLHSQISADWWAFVPSKTKRARPDNVQFVYLTAPARDIIGRQKPSESDHVFRFRSRPIASMDVTKASAKYRNETKTGDWTARDLRRTVATRMTQIGVTERIVELVLNHATNSVAQKHYIKHQYRDQIKDAYTRWTEHLIQIAASEPSL